MFGVGKKRILGLMGNYPQVEVYLEKSLPPESNRDRQNPPVFETWEVEG